MKSIKARLNGQEQEFLKEVKLWGVWKTMDKYGFKDYHAVRSYIQEATGNENYGISPQFGSLGRSSNNNILDQFVERFASFVERERATHKADIEKRDERIRLLEQRLAYYEKHDIETIESKLVAVLESL